MSYDPEHAQEFDEDSEDEFDWEEVEVPEQQHFEITIQTSKSRQKTDTVNKKKGISHAERLIRIDCHKIHTVALLGNASIRNRWLNDPLLHARLLSLTPLKLQTAFGTIHKSRIPDQNQRGRTFETAITNLAEWWSSTFFEVTFDGHIRNQTFDEVQSKIDSRKFSEDIGVTLDSEDTPETEREVIRSSKSLMKHALMRTGSRDVSAQLFTSLCRALDIPARLIVSLQSVPWQTSIGKPKPTYHRKPKGKEKGISADGTENSEGPTIGAAASSQSISTEGPESTFLGNGQRLDDGAIVPRSEKAKGKQKAEPVIKLRKTKSKGNRLGDPPESSAGVSSNRQVSPDPVTTPPVFWTEVFSRPDARWIPVDPIRCIVNKRKVFDPTPTTPGPTVQPSSAIYPHPYAITAPSRGRTAGRLVKEENRMVYVVGFEEDGYARDLTRRYAREFSAKTSKVQGGSNNIGGGGKGRQAWWGRVVGAVTRPYRLHRDDVEDEELEAAQLMEGMPTTISGFKDHPLYALTRHLKQTQVIHPPPPETKELGKFRGEPVYPRSTVVNLKTAENWMRSEGRVIKEGCQPLKFVKVRAGTVGRMRELEVLKDELRIAGEASASGTNGTDISGEVMQGLYARSQTELYTPNPIVDGKIPKNNYGNIDLYVPSMLPQGAVHIPFKGTAKIARKLGFDYAEAVTGFEFKKRRAFPIIEGVVIAKTNEAVLLEAYWEAEQDAEDKARVKREERVIRHWTRIIQGLRIRQRVQDQYASKPNEGQETDVGLSVPLGETMAGGGGFLLDADDVVQPFHLPKYQHINLSGHSPAPANDKEAAVALIEEATSNPVMNFTYDLHTLDAESDTDMEEITPLPQQEEIAPKTMQEMAEDAARLRDEAEHDPNSDEYIDMETNRSTPFINAPDHRVTSGRAIPISSKTSKASTPKSPTWQTNERRERVNSTRTSKQPPTKRRRRATDSDEEINEGEDESHSSPKKRIRSQPTVPAVITPTVVHTRTLRPRVLKTPAQILEEQKQEDAFRRAVAR